MVENSFFLFLYSSCPPMVDLDTAPALYNYTFGGNEEKKIAANTKT